MPTKPLKLWTFSPDEKDFNCRHKEVREELTKKKGGETETAAGEMKT